MNVLQQRESTSSLLCFKYALLFSIGLSPDIFHLYTEIAKLTIYILIIVGAVDNSFIDFLMWRNV